MNYHWNWAIFWELSPDGVHTYFQTLMLGTGWTLATAACAWIIALTLGSLVGALRTMPFAAAVRFGNVYVELFRNVPLLVQMFLWYFVMPEIVPHAFGTGSSNSRTLPSTLRWSRSGSTCRRASPSRCAPGF